MPRGKTDKPVTRGPRSPEYARRNGLMMEQCVTCVRYRTCVHRCRANDIETLCVFLIENESRRCWMCVKEGRACDFTCFRYERSAGPRMPVKRESKGKIRGGKRGGRKRARARGWEEVF